MQAGLDVITFGEAMANLIAQEMGDLHQVSRFTRSLAGAETNVAIGLARLGLRVGWVSKLGDDPFGRYIMDAIQAEKIEISVQVDATHPTAFQLKSKVASGDPVVHYYRNGSAASTLCANDLNPANFEQAIHLHMTGIPLAISNTAREFAARAQQVMKEAGRTISFDPNLRPKLWNSQAEMVQTVNAFAVQSDWVLPGITEGEILTGYTDPRDIAAFYLDQGVKLVVVKLGAEGAFAKTATDEMRVSAIPVKEVVDTVGAGDGFAAGVISGLLEGLSIKEAVMRGNAIGALQVMSPGDMDGLPTRPQLEAFLQQSCQRSV